jgi:hypothetical protein
VGSTAGGAVVLVVRLFLRVELFCVVGAVFRIIETGKGYFAGFVIEAVDAKLLTTFYLKLNVSRCAGYVHLVATQRFLYFDCLGESFKLNAFTESETVFRRCHDGQPFNR